MDEVELKDETRAVKQLARRNFDTSCRYLKINQDWYNINRDSIKLDLTTERPLYALTSYAPGKGESNLVDGIDLSPEELRMLFYNARAANDISLYPEQELVSKAEAAVSNILNNIDGAYQFALSNSKSQPAPSTSTFGTTQPAAFGSFGSTTVNPSPFGALRATGAFGSSAFGTGGAAPSVFGSGSAPSAFGTGGAIGTSAFSAAPASTSPFGSGGVFGSSTSGTAGGGFGAFSGGSTPAFGAAPPVPSPFGTSTFGQTPPAPSSFGQIATPAFGASPFSSQPSSNPFGAAASVPTALPFGQAVAPTAFGAPAFGQAAAPASGSAFGAFGVSTTPSAFGVPPVSSTGGFGGFAATSTPGTSAFGSGGVLGGTPSAFGSGGVQGVSAFGSGGVQGTSAFGSGGVQGTSAFGSGGVQGTSAFGTGGVQGTNAFGQASTAPNPFGSQAGVFGSSPSTFGTTPAPSAFGSGGFSTAAPTALPSNNAFAAFGQPQATSGGFGAFGAQAPASLTPTPSVFNQSSGDPYAELEKLGDGTAEEMTAWGAEKFSWGGIPSRAPPVGVR